MISIFLNLLRIFSGLACDLFWGILCVHLKRTCILLLLDEMFQIQKTYMIHIPYVSGVLKLLTIIVLLSIYLPLLIFALCIRCFYFGCIYIHNCYFLVGSIPLLLCKVLLCLLLQFLFYSLISLFKVLLLQLSFPFCFHLYVVSFSR